LLHLVGSSILLYLIDDARSNKNQNVLRSDRQTGVSLRLFRGSTLSSWTPFTVLQTIIHVVM